MQLALIGATGRIGRHIAAEAAARGHAVTSLTREVVDIFDRQALARALQGHDAVVSAYGAPTDALLHLLATVATSVTQAARLAGVPRVLTIGGAGVLEVAPGVRLGDTPDFPAALQPKVAAHAAAIGALLASEGVAWTCLVPAAQIGPGAGTGRYRTAVHQLVRQEDGRSTIAYPDFARAVVDVAESRRFVREVVGVGD